MDSILIIFSRFFVEISNFKVVYFNKFFSVIFFQKNEANYPLGVVLDIYEIRIDLFKLIDACISCA